MPSLFDEEEEGGEDGADAEIEATGGDEKV
jgi:hypothetical protein